jgi:hypothetical protein
MSFGAYPALGLKAARAAKDAREQWPRGGLEGPQHRHGPRGPELSGKAWQGAARPAESLAFRWKSPGALWKARGSGLSRELAAGLILERRDAGAGPVSGAGGAGLFATPRRSAALRGLPGAVFRPPLASRISARAAGGSGSEGLK